jgi:hypothetical protein
LAGLFLAGDETHIRPDPHCQVAVARRLCDLAGHVQQVHDGFGKEGKRTRHGRRKSINVGSARVELPDCGHRPGDGGAQLVASHWLQAGQGRDRHAALLVGTPA